MENKRGFTLMEVLIVVVIVSVLAALLFPVYARSRERAQRSACSQEMRQIVLAVMLYREDNDGRLPYRDDERVWDSELDRYTGNATARLMGHERRGRHRKGYYQYTYPGTQTVRQLGVGDANHRPCRYFGWDVNVKTGEVRAWTKVPPSD